MKFNFKIHDWGCSEQWWLLLATGAALWRDNDLMAAVFVTGGMVINALREGQP